MSEIKRTWSIPTSPRSPYKLAPELNLLTEFEGEQWNREVQTRFAQRLSESDFYEGSVPANLDFAARDRINRSPKTFGFVDFIGRRIHITDAGKRLISGRRIEELFTRQLLKWQYPSPKHKGNRYINFKIKPFLELLRLVYDLEGLSKREIAIFMIPFIDFEKYEEVKSSIVNFRNELSQLSGLQKKRFILNKHLERYREVYAQELSDNSFHVRQQHGQTTNAETFIKTKVRNSIDYSDAAIRYFRATGIFKLSATTFRLQILDSKKDIVREILSATSKEPEIFEGNEALFLEKLGNPDLPLLPDDRPEVLQLEITKLLNTVSVQSTTQPQQIDRYRPEQLVSATTLELKEKRDELTKMIKEGAQKIQTIALQSYDLFSDVIEMYQKIINRSDYDIPDKPLFFEWNTWRAFAMLDDGEIICNANLDTEGKPLSVAPGGGADNICYYDNFALIVEVTLMRGERQFEAEHESVPRHLGKLTKLLRDRGDQRPVFGIFIASGLNPSTIAHFYSLRRIEVLHYGGKAKIIPLDLNDFKQMLVVAKEAGGIESSQLLNFLEWADQQADCVSNELEWYASLQQKIPTWITWGNPMGSEANPNPRKLTLR